MTAISTSRCEIRLGDRPLLVCDVDDVVLDFITPFTAFLGGRGHELRAQSFRLTGNVFSLDDGLAADRQAVALLTDAFFAEQDAWQTAAREASESLGRLSGHTDIVFLTAMPPRYHALRRRVLDAAGMPYPMISTDGPKGPEVEALHGGRPLPVAFVDDIFVNLHSVRDCVPEALLVNLMCDHALRPFAPHPGEGIETAEDWPAAEALIRARFGLPEA